MSDTVLPGPFTQAATNRLTGFREYVKGSEVEVIYDLQMANSQLRV